MYFGVLIGNQGKQWSPLVFCVSFSVSLVQWMAREKVCFLLYQQFGETKTEDYSVKKSKANDRILDWQDIGSEYIKAFSDSASKPSVQTGIPSYIFDEVHLKVQSGMNHFVRDLELSKHHSELLVSCL